MKYTIITCALLAYISLHCEAEETETLPTTKKWGIGVSAPTLKEAQEIAEQGDSEAQFRLGNHYLSPIGMYIRNEMGNNSMLDTSSKNDKEAIKWLTKAAANGHYQAIYSLAECYEEGNGVTSDQHKALELFESAAAISSDGIAEYSIAGIYFTQSESNLSDSDNARELIDSISSSPNPRSKEKAVFWLKKSCDKNHLGAKKALGHLYMKGNGIQKNEMMAIQLLGSCAPLSLATYYKEGKFVYKDYNKAFKWYQKAANIGDSMGMFHLGDCYGKGIGVSKNQEEAVKWYIKAAENNTSPTDGDLVAQQDARSVACYNLGAHYQQGVGVLKNDLEAYAYFFIARSFGDRYSNEIVESYESKLFNKIELEAGKLRADDLLKQIENGKILPSQKRYEQISTRP